MKLDTFNLNEILPHWMREDDFDAALADAITEILLPVGKRAKTLSTWGHIDDLTSEELDELAWEINIDWWQSTWDLQTKKRVIKTAQEIISKRGTKWAVEQLVTSIYGSGKITEWFEDGTDPYHFSITTSAPSTEEGMAAFLNMIDKVKPARSYLDSIEFYEELRHTIYAGVALSSHMNNIIIDSRRDEDTITQPLYAGTAIRTHYHNTII